MQKVVSNSSPIIHLAKIGKLELLKDYFQTIIIPDEVYKECVIEGLEREEVGLIKRADWFKVVQVKDKRLVRLLTDLRAGKAFSPDKKKSIAFC